MIFIQFHEFNSCHDRWGKFCSDKDEPPLEPMGGRQDNLGKATGRVLSRSERMRRMQRMDRADREEEARYEALKAKLKARRGKRR